MTDPKDTPSRDDLLAYLSSDDVKLPEARQEALEAALDEAVDSAVSAYGDGEPSPALKSGLFARLDAIDAGAEDLGAVEARGAEARSGIADAHGAAGVQGWLEVVRAAFTVPRLTVGLAGAAAVVLLALLLRPAPPTVPSPESPVAMAAPAQLAEDLEVLQDLDVLEHLDVLDDLEVIEALEEES